MGDFFGLFWFFFSCFDTGPNHRNKPKKICLVSRNKPKNNRNRLSKNRKKIRFFRGHPKFTAWSCTYAKNEPFGMPAAYVVPWCHTVECVYWTEPKATCCQCKTQPNAYNMYTNLEEILSACLHLHVSFYSGVVNFCRNVFSHINKKHKKLAVV